MRGLIVVGTLKDGGVQKIMFDYVSRIYKDIDFEFVCYDSEPGIIGTQLEAFNIPYHFVTPTSQGFFKHRKELMAVYKNGHYDFVHDNGGYRSYFNLKYAKKCGVKTRIAHTHVCHMPENLKQYLVRKFFTFLTKTVATDLYGCSNEAGRWTWGEKSYNSGKVHTQNNAIEVKRYLFDPEKRMAIRKQLGIENKFVIGHIGRFTYQKNHKFLVKSFAAYHKKNQDAVLMLMGTGELEAEIKQMVNEMQLNDNVMFLGMRKDANELLNAMDLFVLPSRYEGFAIVLFEAETNGLPCITNDDMGANEANILDRIKYVKKNDFEEWQEALENHGDRLADIDLNMIQLAGFDIDTNAENQKKLYIETVKKHNGE